MPTDRGRIERLLAAARLFLGITSLVAIYLDPTEPARYTKLAYTLLILYALVSFGIWLFLHSRSRPSRGFVIVLHCADVVWPSVITWFTAGPDSPFFAFFIFVLLAAAYRWGFPETLATCAASMAIVGFQSSLLLYGDLPAVGLPSGGSTLNRLVIRWGYLAMIGVLFGYLAKEEKELRARASAATLLIGRARSHSRMRAALRAVLGDLRSFFAANRALLVTAAAGSDEAFLWTVDRSEPADEHKFRETRSRARQRWLAPAPAGFYWKRVKSRTDVVAAIDGRGRRLSQPVMELRPELLTVPPFRSVVAVTSEIPERWTFRLFLFDPAVEAIRAKELVFLQALVGEIAPVIHGMYLENRLRWQTAVIERARVARELHDSSIQSLIALEMRLAVLHRKLERDPAAAEIVAIQKLLREQVLTLRELLQELKPLELGRGEFRPYLRRLVEKFHRETGIAATFVSETGKEEPSRATAHEMIRIVQEALVNVRKHSGARNAIVWLGTENGDWKVVVEDDGRGFPFSGRLDDADLEREHTTPASVRERVRALGGQLAIESTPGVGARLQVLIPRTPETRHDDE